MNYNNKGLTIPQNEISIFDGNHITSEKTKFTIDKVTNKKDIDKTEFIVVGINNEKYNGICSKSTITITSKQNKVVFYLKDNSTYNIIKKEIYNEENQKNIFSIVEAKGVGQYKVEFVNLAKEKSESFEMISDHMFKECHIFYGEEQKGAPMICKIIRKGDSCEIMIAPNIDYIFIMGLASFFFCENIYNNKNSNNNKNDYDNIARMAMPDSPKLINKDEYKDKFQNNNYHDITERSPKKIKTDKKKVLCFAVPAALCACLYCGNEECCCKKRRSLENANIVAEGGEALVVDDDGICICCDDDECCDGDCCGDCCGDCGGCDGIDIGGCVIM